MAPPELPVVETASIDLPWGAWHGDRQEALPVPASWQVRMLRMAGARPLSHAEVAQALDSPLDAPPLAELAAGKGRVAIAIDDITRPTRTAPLLHEIVARLAAAGMPTEAITIIVASGAHRRASARDLEMKVGRELLGTVRVVAHDPGADVCPTGVALGGVPVNLNRFFIDADLRIGIGSVMPHPFAGFSGGGKIVIPGLADLDVLQRTHKFALMGLRGGAGLDGNRFRTEMEEAVRRIGLDWTVNVAVNANRDAAFVAAGHFVSAHRAAAGAAAAIGSTKRPSRPLDALVLNAYPKDGELLQIESAFVALRSGMIDWLAPHAPVVLTGACVEGLGHHDLFGPGGRLWRVPSAKTFLGGRQLWVYGAGLDSAATRTTFAEQYPAFATWDRAVAELSRQLPADAVVGAVPCGPLQLAENAAEAHAAAHAARGSWS